MRIRNPYRYNPLPVVLAVAAMIVATLPVHAESVDPSTTLWYSSPARSWQYEALPIGNGRLGAMIFGGVGHERIALNEDTVWSGSRVNWNRHGASGNLPKIRELLLTGKNEEAEKLVNETFTCVGGGSHGGARGPWGCYQELGNLHLVWDSDVESIRLNEWKYKVIETPERPESDRQVGEAVKVGMDETGWTDYVLDGGKAVKGARVFKIGDRAVLRHHLKLTKEQLDRLGVLRVSPEARNGRVFVNGQDVGELAGWESVGNEVFRGDVSRFLVAGENIIAIDCMRYRQTGQLPLSASLDPREDTQRYRRSLDLRDAVATVEYEKDGVTYTREAFASAPEQVMVFRFTANKPGKVSFTASLDRLASFQTQADGTAGLLMTGQTSSGQPQVEGMKFVARLRALHSGGKVSVTGDTLHVESADEVVLLVAAATDYQGFAGRNTPDPLAATADDMARAAGKSFAQLRAAHVADHRSYFDRVSIRLDDGKEESRTTANLPTGERLAGLAKGGSDPSLAALYFNYGRYLLINSSRPGCMPANLQGIWAEGISTPWNCDYHIDINVQMNYWPAEVTGLGDCHTPLFKLIESLQKPGAETAKEYYNADGWVAHVITNVWGFTAPGEQAGWGATATGSPWLCDHLWEHYDYNRDKEFLKWAYPIMKGSAEFFLDMLITDPKTGWLVTAPSNSPENLFKKPDGQAAHVCMGPTMDMQILRELFGNCIEASKELGMDEAFRARLAATRAKLAPNQIGRHGQIQEWLEDYEETELNHRHVSHLYGLHPYDEITPENTPELAKAARVTLERRGDGSTGWSMAWKANFWTRLHDGNRAHKLLTMLIKGGGQNLLCQCAPFQIDGNFGGTAAIAEMLIQSHGRGSDQLSVTSDRSSVIILLPALPDAWPEGKVTGLRARGGYQVDIEWKNAKLTRSVIRNVTGTTGECVIRYGGVTTKIAVPKGESRVFTGNADAQKCEETSGSLKEKIGVPEQTQSTKGKRNGELKLPRVLLLGDSISGGYAGQVDLNGKALAVRCGNGGPTTVGVKYLDEVLQQLGDEPWDLIHFNWGLHDMTFQTPMAPEERGIDQYAARLEQLVVRLKKTGAKLIWATTTPWCPEPYEYAAQKFKIKLQYSAEEEKQWKDAALNVMKKHDIPVNDLHALLLPNLKDYLNKPDDIHFNHKADVAMGRKIAEVIGECLQLDLAQGDGQKQPQPKPASK